MAQGGKRLLSLSCEQSAIFLFDWNLSRDAGFCRLPASVDLAAFNMKDGGSRSPTTV